MAVIGSLSVKLGLVTVEWDKATADAKQKAVALKTSMDQLGGGVKELNNLWKQMGGTLAIGSASMAALVAQTINFADQISDLSDAMGVSTGFALQFSDALQKAGVSSEAAGKIIGKLYENIEKAKEGNQSSIDQFRNLGITFTEIKQLSPEDAIRRVINELGKIEDPIKRISEARKVLGKGGLGLDIQEVDNLIKNGLGNWEKYGENIKKIAKVKDQLTASMNNLTIAFSQFIGPLAHEGTVSVEKFTGALAGLATYFVAAKVISYTVALTQFVTALRAATVAGAAFNLMANGSPLMLALKLAAAGTAFLIYQRESGQSITKVSQQNYDAAGNVISTESENSLLPSNNVAPRKTEGTTAPTAKSDEASPEEKAASVSLQIEKIKRLNAEALNAVPIWDSFSKSIVAVGVESSNALASLNEKRAQLQVKYKDSPALLGLELGKLKEQEKQIISNTQRKIAELQYQREITQQEEERVRLEGYRAGLVKMSEDESKRRLEQAKISLNIQLREIDTQAELNNLLLEGNISMTGFAKAMVKETLEVNRSLDKLNAELRALPEYINMPEEMLSNEAKANNQRIDAIKTQIEFEQKRHALKMANLQAEQTFDFGVSQALKSYVENATNMAKVGADSFNALTSNMNSALDNFVKTGKLSFKDLARSIIQDLIAIQLKAQASGIMGMLAKSFGFGGGGFTNDAGGMELAGSLGFADGGDPPVGRASLVGERGPELFVPKTAGTIIPNHALGNVGGTTNVTNNYINAIDTKSFEERLLGSSNAVWAANTYANKNLATNYGRT